MVCAGKDNKNSWNNEQLYRKTVDKCVDNSVNNLFVYPQNPLNGGWQRDIHTFIHRYFWRFPHFFAEKRYKLINFAPKKGIVDKVTERLRIRKKQLMFIVDKFIVYRWLLHKQGKGQKVIKIFTAYHTYILFFKKKRNKK